MAEQEKMHGMISILLVVGAWVSTVFLLGTSYLIGGPEYLGGLLIIASAALARRVRRAEASAAAVFLSQAELAFSLCGKTLFCVALVLRWRLGVGGGFAVVAVMAALSYPIFRQTADRAVSVCAALCMGIAWPVLTISSLPAVLLETGTVVLFTGAYVLFVLGKKTENPLAWALLGACLFSSSILPCGADWLFSLAKTAPYWSVLNRLLLCAALCAVYARCVRGTANGWIVLGILLLCLFGNMGMAMGLALLVLGFAQKRLSLKIIGAGTMYISLIWLYYNMRYTLLVKSYYLGAAGLLLLGVYAWLKKGETNAQ